MKKMKKRFTRKRTTVNPYCHILKDMPNVIVEAMNFGVPVIAADSPGGTRELLESYMVNSLNHKNHS